MVSCFTENGRSEQDSVGRKMSLQILEYLDFAASRTGQAMEQVKHGDRVKGPYRVREWLQNVVDQAADVGTPEASF